MGRTTRSAPDMHSSPATDSPTPASAGTDIARLRELLRQHRFSDVLSGAHAILTAAPGHREALLFTAIAQRFLGQIPEALKTIATLEQLYPRFSRLYEERGRCFVALRQAQPAIDAFLQAVHIN